MNEARKLSQRAWAKRNEKYLRLYRQRYYQKHKARCHENGKRWRAQPSNREKMYAYNVRSKYGLSSDDLQRMLQAQDWQCCICRVALRTEVVPRHDSRKGKLVVDHDHQTGRVRGLLCVGCNAGIGALQDDPVLLERALNYIRENSRQEN